MSMSEKILAAREDQNYSGLLAHFPYAQLIGMQALQLGEQLTFVLPANEGNIGNRSLPAIHGGCIGGFMENAARIHVLSLAGVERLPKVVNFSLDYLRPGRFRETYASCQVVRQGNKAVNVAIKAWQTHDGELIANARTHLLL